MFLFSFHFTNSTTLNGIYSIWKDLQLDISLILMLNQNDKIKLTLFEFIVYHIQPRISIIFDTDYQSQ